jgi:hypothetical protein
MSTFKGGRGVGRAAYGLFTLPPYNQQIQKDRSDYSVIRDAASPKHCPSDTIPRVTAMMNHAVGQQVQVV